MNIPLPILIVFFSLFTGLISHIYFKMNKTLENLTNAVNNLNTFMTTTEEKIKKHDDKLNEYDLNMKDFNDKFIPGLKFLEKNHPELLILMEKMKGILP